MTDLFQKQWQLEPLDISSIGPYQPAQTSDADKDQLWQDYNNNRPARVPVRLAMNDRIVMLDQRAPRHNFTYQHVFTNPQDMLTVNLLQQYFVRQRFHHFCDLPTELPDCWTVGIHFQNVYEAWFFNCPLSFRPQQIPDTEPYYNDDRKNAIFDIDITNPLQRDPFRRAVEFYETLTDYCRDKTFLDRPIRIAPPAFISTDGPLTVAMNLRSQNIIMDMIDDPDYAHKLFDFITEAALIRRRHFAQRFNLGPLGPGLADDSIAMLSTQQYREFLMPHHRRWYQQIGSKPGQRSIHLCGDATRHFPLLHDELGITTFDTGFPVNFTWLRETLGPNVTIQGGVEVHILLNASPQDVYNRSRDILQSGIKNGRRFIFTEANNLPADVPYANLAAMYQAAFDFGKYD